MFQRFHRALPMDIRVVNEREHVTVEDLNFTLCKWHCRIARRMREFSFSLLTGEIAAVEILRFQICWEERESVSALGRAGILV